MTDLIVIAYREQSQANKVITALHHVQSEGWIEIEDAAYITVESDGRVRVHQDRALTQEGKKTGPVWGILLEMLFSSLFQIVGNAPEEGLAGALAYDVASSASGVSSTISAILADYGFDEAFIQNLRMHMLLNSSTIFVMARKVMVDKIIAEISTYRNRLVHNVLICYPASASRGPLPEEKSRKTALLLNYAALLCASWEVTRGLFKCETQGEGER